MTPPPALATDLGAVSAGSSFGPGSTTGVDLLEMLVGPRPGRLVSVQQIPARSGCTASWPAWAPSRLVDAFTAAGCQEPWAHQVEAAELARTGRSVVISTGTGSGKSLAFLLPALSAVLESAGQPGVGLRGGADTVLYLSPTKALAADQLRAVQSLDLPVHAATYDGDTDTEARLLVRQAATYLLTNPDMLHVSMLPTHARWADFLRRLRYVVIDECHVYRGVFGSHVSAVLRRLRRVCRSYGAEPAFLLASATAADPAASAERLTGVPTVAITTDTSPRGARAVGLWQPPMIERDPGADGTPRPPTRRSATAETAELVAALSAHEARSLAFVRSRKGAEAVALSARRHLGCDSAAGVDLDPYRLPNSDAGLPQRVAAYRAGYLPEERRHLESAIRSGTLLSLATTNALELGVDIVGLDAVVIAGWPGTRASFWQQAGRAGRAGADSLVLMVGRDDPLDTFLLHHPDSVFGQPVEATVFDAENPYVLAPHLCAAAAELPLTAEDFVLFGTSAADLVELLEQRGALRRRRTGWFWTKRERAASMVDLRGAGGPPVRMVEDSTGRVLGTVDRSAAPATAHAGAVYLHQGQTYLATDLDLDGGCALVRRADPDYSTAARSHTDLEILDTSLATRWGDTSLAFGDVRVTSQVTSFLRLDLPSGRVLSEEPLDLPAQTLHTRAVWWTVSGEELDAAGLTPKVRAGAAHAAEHASIGLLPLFATCDRWDIGGLSTERHADTGELTVFVYDGAPGGAGFAERGFGTAAKWLSATREAISSCPCTSGCPACVQSPKCGNGNEPLDKAGAVVLLDVLLSGAPGVPERGAGRRQRPLTAA